MFAIQSCVLEIFYEIHKAPFGDVDTSKQPENSRFQVQIQIKVRNADERCTFYLCLHLGFCFGVVT